ncbi:MAG: RNA polymerase sigma factor [FCB group bacterium]|nr:RNA polymerase sigma factor [FCB group bacterium]
MQMKDKGELFWKLLEPEYLQGMMFCRKLMGDRDGGDDLYQDALVNALTGFERLRNPKAFKPWFYRVMINTFRGTIRRPWWKRRVAMTAKIELQLVGDNPIAAHTARRWLKRAFEAVSPEEQALTVLHELEEWNIKELAELYGSTEGSIKARLFRARRKMKKALLKFSRKPVAQKAAPEMIRKGSRCDAVKPSVE